MSELGLKRDSFITILSTRKSGKSYLIRELIYYFLTSSEQKCDYLYMFSNTAKFDASGTFNFVDKKVTFSAHPDVVEKIVKSILQLQLENQKKTHILLMFDDIDLSAKYDQSLELLATRGRHFNITTILSAQIATRAISPAIRNNTTYLFFRKLNAETIKKQIYSMIVSNSFETPQQLYDFVQQNIDDFKFVFYDNDSDKKELLLFKADPIPEGFQYKVKAPKDETNTSKVAGKGYGVPINMTLFNSAGNPLRPNPNGAGMKPI